MKLIAKFLTLLLCFELIVAPISGQLGYSHFQAFAEVKCPEGQQEVDGRCQATDEAARIMHATQSCGGDMNCFQNNARDAFGTEKAPGFGDEDWATGLTKGAALLFPILMAFNLSKMPSTHVCSDISFWLMVGAGAALIIGDIIINKAHYDRLADIKKKWGEIVKPTAAGDDKDKQQELSINAQSEAFQKLADAEESMEKAASEKETLYWVATAAYGSAAIIALIETMVGLTTGAAAKPCQRIKAGEDTTPNKNWQFQFKSEVIQEQNFNPISKQFLYNIQNSKNFTDYIMNQKAMEKAYSSPSLDEYYAIHDSLNEVNKIAKTEPEIFNLFKSVTSKLISEVNPLPPAFAEGETNASMAYDKDGEAFNNWDMWSVIGGAVLGVAGGLGALGAKWMNQVNMWMLTSWGRVTIGGVLGLATGFLAGHASGVKDDSITRKNKLLDLKKEFYGAASALDTCKSEDRNDPSKPNCYCYTAENKRNPNRSNSQICASLWAGPNTSFKNASNYSSTQKVCVNKQYNPDPLCSCRKTASCLKSGPVNLKGVGTGTLSMINSGFGPMNDMTSGNASLGQIGSTSPGGLAARTMAGLKKMMNSPQFAKHKKNVDKGMKELVTSANKAAAALPAQALNSSNSSLPTNAKEAARMLEKELAPPSSPTTVNGNQGTIAAPTGSEEKIPDFGMSDEQAAQQEAQVAEVMGKNLDYGGTDINNSSKANIFEVLTNRYQRSGMRRLFDENNTSPVEAPAKTEINK